MGFFQEAVQSHFSVNLFNATTGSDLSASLVIRQKTAAKLTAAFVQHSPSATVSFAGDEREHKL